MPKSMTKTDSITLEIGDMPILLRTDNAEFVRMIENRYGPFVNSHAGPAATELEVKLLPSPDGWRWDAGLEEGQGDATEPLSAADEAAAIARLDLEDDVKVSLTAGLWTMQRGDFRAEWDPETRRGWVQSTINPYSIDGVLRILHSLILAREGGLLIHGASAVRNGKAFIFAGISGTGKTTISRLAPPDVKLLTDEISYVRDVGRETGDRESGYGNRDPGSRVLNAEFGILNRPSESPAPYSQAADPQLRIPDSPAFVAYGTPFAGELAKIGEKLKAPLAGLFLLKQGPENRIEELGEKQAVTELMRHILFFARDSHLVNTVFETVCGLVRRVPVQRLVFKKDSSVWELIG
jgi:hypothetical protein